MNNYKDRQNKNNQNGGFSMKPGRGKKVGDVHPPRKAHEKIRRQGSQNTEERLLITEIGEKQQKHNHAIDTDIFPVLMKKQKPERRDPCVIMNLQRHAQKQQQTNEDIPQNI